MSLYVLARDNDIEELCDRATGSDSPAVRRRAAEVLGDVGDPEDDQVVDTLVRLARGDDDERVRAAAIDGLDDLGGGAVETLLSEAFDIDDADSDWATARKFARALEADVPELRMAAANALGRLDDPEGVGPLTERLADPDPRVRERVCYALGRLGDPRPVGQLIDRLGDDSGAVRTAAADALGSIASDRALAALLELLDDENPTIRRVAASALGNAASAKPVPELAAALGDDHGAVRRAAVFSIVDLLSNVPTDQSHRVRETVVSELREADDETVVGPLVEILEEASQPRQRRNAVWFLGRVTGDEPGEAVLEALVAALDDDDRMTAQFAATSVAELEGKAVESTLIEAAEDDELSVDARAKAAYALGDVGGDRAKEALERLTGDGVDEQVRKRAFAALSKLGGVR